MKQFWKKFTKKFSQIRDYLIMVLVGAGILYAMQTTQAVESQEAVVIWQDEYAKNVRGPDVPVGGEPIPGGMPPVPGGPAPAEQGGGDIATGNIDFSPISPSEIGPISYRPVFTPATNFSALIERLKKLRLDYQEAIKDGNIAVAIKVLQEYVKDDPKGTLLEWPTPPEELLRNHICSEIGRTLNESAKQGESALEEAGQSGADLLQSIESLDSTLTLLDRTIQESSLNDNCFEGTDISMSDVKILEDLRERILNSREDLNKKLVLQRYEEVVQRVSAITADSDPEEVSTAIQSLTQFERILENRNKDYLIQSQLDRLKDLQDNLEKNKEAIIKNVLQEISRLAADDTTSRDSEGIREILRLYDVLEVLKVPESEISRDRRKWESTLSKLEASEGVQLMREKLREVRAALEKGEEELSAGRIPKDALTVYNDRMAEVQGIQKRTKEIRRVPGYAEVNGEIRELQSMARKIEARSRSLSK